MIGKAIGTAITVARDFIARALIKAHVTPDMLTFLGMLLTVATGFCYAFGARSSFAWSLSPGAPANAYLLLAGLLLLLASACDMLDGAVARLGRGGSSFGAFMDSTLDRFSDFAVYAGIAIAYAWSSPANVTFILLSMLAFFNAFMISYTKARAENLIDSCPVGFWKRGERSAAILIATLAYNIPALLVQQALLTAFTLFLRINYTRAVLAGRKFTIDPRQGSLALKLCVWRWPRKTLPYDLTCIVNIAWLIFVRFKPFDWLRETFG